MGGFVWTTLVCSMSLVIATNARRSNQSPADMKNMQIDINVLSNEFDRMNQKLDILLSKVGGMEEWNKVEPGWPPLTLLNVSHRTTEDDGAVLTVWYQTQSSCNDVRSIWTLHAFWFKIIPFNESELVDSSCTCVHHSCLGWSSVTVEGPIGDKHLSLVLKDTHYNFLYKMKLNLKPKVPAAEAVRSKLFFMNSEQDVVYSPGKDPIIDMFYSTPEGKSGDIRLEVELENLGNSTGEMRLEKQSVSVNTDAWSSSKKDLCIIENEKHFLHFTRFQLRINSTKVEPLGFVTVNAYNGDFDNGPIKSLSVLQKVTIHKSTQKQPYPEKFLQLDAISYRCTLGDNECNIFCDAVGNHVRDIRLSPAIQNNTKSTVVSEIIDINSNYRISGYWSIETPRYVTTLDYECSVTYEDNATSSTNVSITVVDVPKILLNESGVSYNDDNHSLSVQCAARGGPHLQLSLSISMHGEGGMDFSYINIHPSQYAQLEQRPGYVIKNFQIPLPDRTGSGQSPVSTLTVFCHANVLDFYSFRDEAILVKNYSIPQRDNQTTSQ
ncbi:uncharacterized protein LOC101851717 [Aplysia californica]|uniref:Uncharacterized protein LOC101851717 n=1 Tax=Aplysia californica TaxID=6500 RepID=A0ABM0JI07_APLCA|nr:uncharacterized protein LOC101851717 [Aplysia californica]